MPGKGKTTYYFPSRDADVIPWAKNFVTVLAANAARWGIVQPLVTVLQGLSAAYELAYNRRMLLDEGKVSVEQKNLYRQRHAGTSGEALQGVGRGIDWRGA
jgi:hypothetical protein